jgi:hypothetical protein
MGHARPYPKDRYYGANATRHLSPAAPSFRHAQSRNGIKASHLHAFAASCQIGGKLLANKLAAIKIRMAMMQVEAVLQMLQPGFSVAAIAAKRRNKSNPWFKRGTLFRSAVDVMRRAGAPLTAREIADTLMADKAPQATRKQAIDLQAAILVALRKRNGGAVVGEGAPARWALTAKNL